MLFGEIHNLGEGAGLDKKLIQFFDHSSGGRVNDEFLVLSFITKWTGAAVVETFDGSLLEFILDSLGGHLPLKLGEGEHDIAE